MKLTEDVIELLKRPSLCYLATTMPDGSPQLTQTWVDTDGEHVLINSVLTHVKTRNIQRDRRVALTVTDPENLHRYVQIRGRVLEIRTEGAVEHIEELAQRYLGGPYPWFGGREQVRVVFVIEPERVGAVGR
ncbi:MAG TPA: PPOX class F420-dependent oxidoreductase [Actinocrinis sp.]|nr:PPOX class F420-dependent oxidoreductase [Actinocrinis sp.]